MMTSIFEGFSLERIDVGEVELRVRHGGSGPPLLLLHGHPRTHVTWHRVAPLLADRFTVVCPDLRGYGESSKPPTTPDHEPYSKRAMARDSVALMRALGHERFAVAGHDTGFAIGYALAADHPERVDRVVLAEIPGPPEPSTSPPVFVPEPINNRLWHLGFNRVETLPEQLIAGREDVFFGYEFAIQGGELPAELVDYYVGLVSDPESLRGSLGWYRALDATLAQNAERKNRPLTMPVLAVGGELSYGGLVAESLKPLAEDVQGVVLPGTGHWVAEQAPELLLEALTGFLAPYRAGLVTT
jgi:pimeloyl-ACP methyl ester carboxylesterase